MVGAVGGEEERLGAGARGVGVEEHGPDLPAELGAAGFTRRFDAVAFVGQRSGEAGDLGALARTVAAFDGDEESGTEAVGECADASLLASSDCAWGRKPWTMSTDSPCMPCGSKTKSPTMPATRLRAR